MGAVVPCAACFTFTGVYVRGWPPGTGTRRFGCTGWGAGLRTEVLNPRRTRAGVSLFWFGRLAASISSTTAMSASRPRAAATTRAPCRPNSMAVARPMPLEAPVTTTTWSGNGFVLCIVCLPVEAA